MEQNTKCAGKWSVHYTRQAWHKVCATDLLHNTSLALGEGYVTARFILDKFDINLATLLATLLIIIIVVVGIRALALSRSSRVDAETIVVIVVVRRRYGRIVI